MSVFDTKQLPAHTAVIYLACAHSAGHRHLTKRTRILERFRGGRLSSQLCRRCVCRLRDGRGGLRRLLRLCLRLSLWRRRCPGLAALRHVFCTLRCRLCLCYLHCLSAGLGLGGRRLCALVLSWFHAAFARRHAVCGEPLCLRFRLALSRLAFFAPGHHNAGMCTHAFAFLGLFHP